MTKMKTIFAVIFLALLIPVLLAAQESEAKVYQGKWKNNTTWNYDTRENTLMIKCCGKMIDDIEDCGEHLGWPRFYTSAQKIVLVKGITYIGSGAFEGFSHIKKIQIPNGVTQIGKSAFEDCYKLHKIYFPETLKSIENDAFNVYRLPGAEFTTLNRQVRSFCIVSDDVKLIGTRNGLLLVSEKENRVRTFTTQDYPALLSNSILFIQPFGGGDDYLIGTTKGLVLFSLKETSFRAFSEENVYKGTQFYSCLADEEGIWLATSEKVLYYNMNTNQTDIYPLDTNKYPGCAAWSLCFDSRNRLWIGTSEGVFLLDKATHKIMDTFEGKEKLKNISKAQINNISRSKNGKLFICTDRMGLIVLNERGSEVNVYSEDNILPHNTVYSVYEDDQEVWWIATMKGILRYNRVTDKKQLYDLSAGIPGGVCRSFYKDSRGNYWWANEMGLVVCNPYQLSQAVLCNLPCISSVKIAGKQQLLLEDKEQGVVTPAYAKSMILPAFQNNLELCFSMHTYLGALDSYQYILEGLDERWKYNRAGKS